MNVSEEVNASKIVCVGGDTKSVEEIYSISDDQLNNYPALPFAVSYCSVLKLDDFIYCMTIRQVMFIA